MSCQLCTDENHHSCAVTLCGLFGQESCCCDWMTLPMFRDANTELVNAEYADMLWHER